ncbi:MAG: potassium-transporting ATPase subunit F [Methylacidiphilales bacterium]|nr:potassium-transporting ATPase subunit F [Candidatus Methylacidiphilales bacterium]NJR18385.1 potassium-transporting ATPase subunit F [Calothrix sp. CSU_2_0]
MKKLASGNFRELITYIWQEWRRKKLPIIIFLGISLNIIFAPIVYANIGKLEPRHTYAIAGLAIITLGVIIYLFDVIFRPEKY